MARPRKTNAQAKTKLGSSKIKLRRWRIERTESIQVDRLRVLLRILAPFRIPKLHALTLLDGGGSAQRHPSHDPQYFTDRMRAQFPSGGGHRFPQHHEVAMAL